MDAPTISTATAALAAALGLSLTVERVIEVLKNVSEPMVGKSSGFVMPSLARIEKNVDAITELHQNETARIATEEEIRSLLDYVSKNPNATDIAEKQQRLSQLQEQAEWDERAHVVSFTVQPATKPDKSQVLRNFVLQSVGLITGIVLARTFELHLFQVLLAGKAQVVPAVDYLFTGILIGGGSAPIHVLIQFISERKVETQAPSLDVKEAEVVAAAPVVQAVATAVASGDVLRVPYEGGVDCALLERMHIRSGDPNLIVLHHTAMNMDSTFDDVVRTIKGHADSKGNHWVTGYHCVIMRDGSIRPFCRWDRFGNHAAGYNDRSLGLAFNGNFEPNPKIPFANIGGRYGPDKPTVEQLEAGVRVVALWVLLYGIELNFEKSIVPHSRMSTKTCPGSNFPLTEFNARVQKQVAEWRESEQAMTQLAMYKTKPFLFLSGQGSYGKVA